MAFIHNKQNNEMKYIVIIRTLSLYYTKMQPIQLLTVTHNICDFYFLFLTFNLFLASVPILYPLKHQKAKGGFLVI